MNAVAEYVAERVPLLALPWWTGQVGWVLLGGGVLVLAGFAAWSVRSRRRSS